MKLERIKSGFSGLAATFALVGGLTLATSGSATAAEGPCMHSLGTGLSEHISVCSGMSVVTQPRGSQPIGRVKMTRGSTSATGCNITMWVELVDAKQHTWTSPRRALSCAPALRMRDQWTTYAFANVGTQAATQSRAHACVDLYFGGSKNSGWQRCAPATGWTNL